MGDRHNPAIRNPVAAVEGPRVIQGDAQGGAPVRKGAVSAMRTSLLLKVAMVLLLGSAFPSVAEQISAGKSAVDESSHIERIASNKKQHYACAVSVATKRALEIKPKLSTDRVASLALRECKHFELAHKALLEGGVPTTAGAVAAASPQIVSRLLKIRTRELRGSIVAAIKEVR